MAYPGTANENIHVITILKNGGKELCLKVPKREIFVTELSTLSDPIWVGDLKNEPKKSICVNCWVDIPHFAFLAMSMR